MRFELMFEKMRKPSIFATKRIFSRIIFNTPREILMIFFIQQDIHYKQSKGIILFNKYKYYKEMPYCCKLN